jgi:uridylate kinase
MQTPQYKRIMLKLSGEIFAGETIFSLDAINRVSSDIKTIHEMGIEVNVVIGGGNIFRGHMGQSQGMDRAAADYMGMLATVMNALALQNRIEEFGINARVMTAINMNEIAESFTRRRAFEHLSNGRVVIYAGGLGVPFFSTDTAAASRACEMNCDVILKGTKVDGVYNKDPVSNSDATFYPELTYHDVLTQDLKVMDAASVALAKENKIPVVVFNVRKQGLLVDVVQGKGTYTIIREGN